MLQEEIIQRFIDRLCDTLHYNVNVMNRDGIIIASRDSHRIGTYHEIASEIVRKRKDKVIAQEGDSLPSGVLPGVNLPIIHENQIIGVVGITGNYRDVESVAYSVKTALEIMMEYEAHKEALRRRQDRKKLLANALLYDPSVTGAEIRKLMETLGYRTDMPRIALILRFPAGSGAGSRDRFNTVKTAGRHGSQDISLPTLDEGLVVFKSLAPGQAETLERIVSNVSAYVHSIDSAYKSAALPSPAAYFCGSVQEDVEMYRLSFQHASWLSGKSDSGGEVRVRFFFDYILEYSLEQLPLKEIESLLFPFNRSFAEENASLYHETLRALDDSGMSIKEAAAALGIHRNTMLFRLQKIRDLYGLDPVNINRDRKFITLLLAFLKRHPASGV